MVTGFLEQSDFKNIGGLQQSIVLDGHIARVSLRISDRGKPKPPAEAVKEALSCYISEAQTLGFPSAPKLSILVVKELDRPQPGFNRNTQNGYTVSVGKEGRREGYL